MIQTIQLYKELKSKMIYVWLSAAQYCVLFCVRSVYVGDQMRESGAHVDAMKNLNMLS